MDEFIFFLSPGQKLKQARLELDITQEQLSCEKLSRRAISTIESGLRKLNYSTANIIVERIHELEKQSKQALDIDFTVDYLMEDIETQVTKEIERINEKLSTQKNKKICDELIKRAERIKNEYKANDDLMIKLNNLAIDFYLKTYDLDTALYFTNMNLKIFYSRKDELNTFLMQCYQTKIYTLMEDYKNVISISRTIDINDNVKKRNEYLSVCFNTAVSYYYLNDYKKSMEWLEKINQQKLALNKKLEIINLVGIILIKQNRLDEAEKKYYYIISEAKENCLYDLEANCYSNIAEIYKVKNDSFKALEFINKALEIKVENYTILMNIYRNAFLISLMNNSNKIEITRYFEEALRYSTILKRKTVQCQLFSEYLTYCCLNNYCEDVQHIFSLLKESIYSNIDTGVLILTCKAFLNNDADVYELGIEYMNKNLRIALKE